MYQILVSIINFGPENVELTDIFYEGLFTPALIVKNNEVGNLILFLDCKSNSDRITNI